MRDEFRVTVAEYRLRLDIDFEGQRWDGVVEFDVPAPSGDLELDSEDLAIVSVVQGDRRRPFRLDTDRHRLVIPLEPDGPSNVRVAFRGQVAPDRLTGVYRCRHGGGYVLTTQCEPVAARRVFPCVDRPDAKARIRLVVRAPSALEVIANSSPEHVREADGHREWEFAPTPPMATYLFYFAVGVFDRVEDASARVPVRVLTPPGRRSAGRFGAAVGARILRAYEEYYGLPYPLPKLDMIAVAEHAFGAMENWGAMSFRDVRLLLDGSSATGAPGDITETVCHEIAHQWFGNLVTMAWWDDIWLNESFATFLEAKITEQVAPECEPYTDFVLRRQGMRAALESDALATTHPVRAPVSTPDEIGQTTDEITYGKGASVLRMVDAYLGDSAFRAGVTEYLNRFRFRNARTEDLWDALRRSTGADVAALVGPWIDRPGLPVVRATVAPGGLHLRQQRFTLRPGPEGSPWPIPLRLEVDGRRAPFLFDVREQTVPVPAGATVHLNPGGLGFYRTRYAPELLERLFATLPDRPGADRWIVLNDLAAFVVAGLEDWPTYERAIRALGQGTDRLVAEELADALGALALALPPDAAPARFARSYLRDLTDRLGLDRRSEEPTPRRILREYAALTRVQIDRSFASTLSPRFADWERLDPDLRRAVAIAEARTEGEAGYRRLRTALDRPIPEGEALRLEIALAWSGEPALIDSTLELIASGGINRGHVFFVVGHVAANPVGRPLLLPWLEEHLDHLGRTFRGSMLLSTMLEDSLPLAGLGRSDAVRAYFRDHPIPDADRGIARGLERLETNERLVARLSG